MEAKLRQTYGAWPKGPALKEEASSPRRPNRATTWSRKTTSTRARSAWWDVGIRRDNPDYYAVRVFNEAFGGGFSSRLFRTIRTEKGLAYSVGGGIGTAFDHLGMVRLAHGNEKRHHARIHPGAGRAD